MTPQSILGQRGANLIERIVLEMKCIWRPISIFDVGIDGEIENCDPVTGRATNSVVKVQAIDLFRVQQADKNKPEKMEVLYQYLMSTQFRQRWSQL